MDDQQFKTILAFFNLSFKGYRKVRKGAKKRLVRHMQSIGCGTVKEYLSMIARNQELLHESRLVLTVSISRFFRDRLVWEILQKRLLADFIEMDISKFRVWSAGCARGEEVYSLKIIWEKAIQEGLTPPKLAITATDISPEYLDAARKGVYGMGSVKEVSQPDRETFFDLKRKGKLFSVKPFLRSGINWKILDLSDKNLENVMDRKFDLIFLRNNVLTYLDEKSRETVFNRIVGKLAPGGILIKGAHEVLPETENRFVRAYEHPHIFQITEKLNDDT